MLKNYLLTAIRNLYRRKGFSFINIAGLSMGMASATLILLWMHHELSFDTFHTNKDKIYQVWNRDHVNGKTEYWSSTPKVLGPALIQEYPAIQAMTRIDNRWFITAAGDTKMSTHSYAVDPAFLTMFTFPLIEGNPATALSQPNNIVITQAMSRKMFGTANGMNRIITIDSSQLTVTGILKDLPTNNSFDFEYLLPWSFLHKVGFDDDSWRNNSTTTLIQLSSHAPPATAMAEQIQDITRRHTANKETTQIFLHPLTRMHLYTDYEDGQKATGPITAVRLFIVIAVFILLIACINFMNLSTARSEQRAKEVGVRKVAGAGRGMLVAQFLGESVIIALIAGILALALVQLSLATFSAMINRQLSIPWDNAGFWMIALGFMIGTGILAGSYPAFFLSSFQPVAVLKGSFRKAHAAVNPRKVLVVLQFTFAIVLIISTVIVVHQLRYAQERSRGYDKGQLAYHWASGDITKNYAQLKQELIRTGIAGMVTRTTGPLTENYSDSWGLIWPGKRADDKTTINIYGEDEGLIATTGLQLVQGRDMDLVNYPTDSTAMLLNESAARVMALKDPIGTLVRDGDMTYHVIGVIRDFVIGSPFDRTDPMVIEGKQKGLNVVYMRLAPGQATPQNIAAMEKVFKKFNPLYPFEYHFNDTDYALKFDGSKRMAAMTGLFAGLTVLIACLGLFGLAAYMAENRIREIGVRKVLGASVMSITVLLTREFLGLVLIAFLVASPVAWFIMYKWLQNYSYRIGIEWWVFALTGGLCVLISMLTVGYQAIAAALSNPAKSLRTQ